MKITGNTCLKKGNSLLNHATCCNLLFVVNHKFLPGNLKSKKFKTNKNCFFYNSGKKWVHSIDMKYIMIINTPVLHHHYHIKN